MAENENDSQYDVEPGISPMELRARLAELYIDDLIIPMIISGSIDLAWVLDRIRTGVVVRLAETEEPKSVIADHLQMSERWVYQQLEVFEQARRLERDAEQTKQPSGISKSLITDILLELSDAHPGALSADELRARLERNGRKLTKNRLTGALELSVRLGAVNMVESSKRGRCYTAANPLSVLNMHRGYLDKLSERISSIPALALAYCCDQGEFGGVSARLHPQAFAKARERFKVAASEIIGDAIEETHRSEEPNTNNVPVSALFALGIVGGSHGSK